MSCENFINARFESEITPPGARTTIGCSIGFESVKMVPVGVGALTFANNP